MKIATLEKVQTQLVADETYWEKVGKGTHLFIDGSAQDVVMRQI